MSKMINILAFGKWVYILSILFYVKSMGRHKSYVKFMSYAFQNKLLTMYEGLNVCPLMGTSEQSIFAKFFTLAKLNRVDRNVSILGKLCYFLLQI